MIIRLLRTRQKIVTRCRVVLSALVDGCKILLASNCVIVTCWLRQQSYVNRSLLMIPDDDLEDVVQQPGSDKIAVLIELLSQRLKRLPTDDEVITFINGTHQQRLNIWNVVTRYGFLGEE